MNTQIESSDELREQIATTLRSLERRLSSACDDETRRGKGLRDITTRELDAEIRSVCEAYGTLGDPILSREMPAHAQLVRGKCEELLQKWSDHKWALDNNEYQVIGWPIESDADSNLEPGEKAWYEVYAVVVAVRRALCTAAEWSTPPCMKLTANRFRFQRPASIGRPRSTTC